MRLTALVLALLGAVLAASGPGAPKSGLDSSAFDASIRPQDDLFRYVNGAWIDKAEIPSDRVTYGTFEELTDRSEQNIRSIIEELIEKGPHKTGSAAQQIADLYSSMLDEDRLERLGLAPVGSELRKIVGLKNTRDM